MQLNHFGVITPMEERERFYEPDRLHRIRSAKAMNLRRLPVRAATRGSETVAGRKRCVVDRLRPFAARSVTVRAQDDLDTELALQHGLQVIEIDGALRRIHRQLDACAEVKHFDGPVEILGHLAQ
jgi:hypothetical protein